MANYEYMSTQYRMSVSWLSRIYANFTPATFILFLVHNLPLSKM